MLTYTHNLLCDSEPYPVGYTAVAGGVCCCVGVVFVFYCTGLVYYTVVGCTLVDYLSVFNYLSTVWDMFLIVLFYILSAAYYVS